MYVPHARHSGEPFTTQPVRWLLACSSTKLCKVARAFDVACARWEASNLYNVFVFVALHANIVAMSIRCIFTG